MTYKRDLCIWKETYIRNLQNRTNKRPVKETYKRDLWKRQASAALLMLLMLLMRSPYSPLIARHTRLSCLSCLGLWSRSLALTILASHHTRLDEWLSLSHHTHLSSKSDQQKRPMYMKRLLQKRPTKETYSKDLDKRCVRETNQRDLSKRPTKKTYTRDL